MNNNKSQKGKFKKGKNKNGGGGSKIGNGNFDDIMKGFIIMTDRDREKNAVSDANNFLIPIIEDLYPNLYQGVDMRISNETALVKKQKQDNEQNEEKQGNDDGKAENQNSDEQNNKEVVEENNEQEPNQEEEGVEEKEDQQEDQADDQNDNNEVERPVQVKTANERLEQELNDLKQQKDKLLYNVNTDVKCTVFLKINSKLMHNINATEVVEHIMNKVHNEKTALTRFCHRMFPAEYAFRADEANFKKYMEQLIQEKMPSDAPSSVIQNAFWIGIINLNEIYKISGCQNVRVEITNILDIVNEIMPTIHFVDYKNPFYTVVVDICHNLMCLSILKNYYDYKKYSVKVNPQLNNVKDYSFLNQNKPAPKVQVPVTEEQLKELEQKQEEQKAQLRAEQIVNDEDDVDLI